MKINARATALLAGLFICLNQVAFAQKRPTIVSRLDTVKVITGEEAKKIAIKFLEKSIVEITALDEKEFINKQLSSIEQAKDDSLRRVACIRISSAAMMFLGATNNSNVPIILSAKAAAAYPADPLLVNNFGAALRMVDSLPSAYKILLYAKYLFPQSPVILTNLGNTCFELADDKMAEAFFRRALHFNDDYDLARHGMVNVCLKRKDIRGAMEYLFKGVKGIYSTSLAQVAEEQKNNKIKTIPPEPVKDYGNPGNINPTQDNSSAHSQLKLPPFHQWMDIRAFLADESFSKWNKQLKGLADADTRLRDALNLTKLNHAEQIKLLEKQQAAGRILNDKPAVAMGFMELYFEDQLSIAHRRYLVEDSIAADKFNKAVKELGDYYNLKLQQKGKQVEANHVKIVDKSNAKAALAQEGENLKTVASMADDMSERCKRMRVVIENYFGEWKQIAKRRHETYNRLLETYWIYCEQYLNHTYNPTDYAHLNGQRKGFVAGQYSVMVLDYEMRKLAFGTMNVTAMATVGGECPEVVQEDLSEAQSVDDVEATDTGSPDCPFKNSKGKIGAGICSLALDCESIELECGEGVIGAGKWNYKKKEFTAFVGVGFKAEFGISHVSKISLEAKTGLQTTFNTNGQVIDGGIKTEVGGKYEYGNFSGGGNLEVTAGATGINMETTKELSYNMF